MNTAPVQPDTPRGFWGRLRAVLDMIAFHHTLFALPFALLGMMLAAAPRRLSSPFPPYR